ncbi:MAG: hypothetical protein GY714_19205 [Desulfobacterales bacterium]|nr:hypothetical protein [Desulfobacterales bacterium]MCP4159762.1 hypothetical protein [Deltaproteobacteria bacterium]
MKNRTYWLYSIIISGLIFTVCLNIRNSYFEFCTTKAYGFPFPWKIDYCICEGGKTVLSKGAVIGNATVFIVLSLILVWIINKLLKEKKSINS